MVVYHGGEARKQFSGPLKADRCMSCDLNCDMSMGLTGGGAGGLLASESMIYEEGDMRFWHDGKGRAMFVVTPRRHVRSLAELTADEMYNLWHGAVRIMEDMGCGTDDMKDCILNAGLDQNHAHLHLKVRVHRHAFEKASRRWSSRRRDVIRKLRDFADRHA